MENFSDCMTSRRGSLSMQPLVMVVCVRMKYSTFANLEQDGCEWERTGVNNEALEFKAS